MRGLFEGLQKKAIKQRKKARRLSFNIFLHSRFNLGVDLVAAWVWISPQKILTTARLLVASSSGHVAGEKVEGGWAVMLASTVPPGARGRRSDPSI